MQVLWKSCCFSSTLKIISSRLPMIGLWYVNDSERCVNKVKPEEAWLRHSLVSHAEIHPLLAPDISPNGRKYLFGSKAIWSAGTFELLRSAWGKKWNSDEPPKTLGCPFLEALLIWSYFHNASCQSYVVFLWLLRSSLWKFGTSDHRMTSGIQMSGSHLLGAQVRGLHDMDEVNDEERKEPLRLCQDIFNTQHPCPVATSSRTDYILEAEETRLLLAREHYT